MAKNKSQAKADRDRQVMAAAAEESRVIVQ